MNWESSQEDTEVLGFCIVIFNSMSGVLKDGKRKLSILVRCLPGCSFLIMHISATCSSVAAYMFRAVAVAYSSVTLFHAQRPGQAMYGEESLIRNPLISTPGIALRRL
jgi:hypothetical protein